MKLFPALCLLLSAVAAAQQTQVRDSPAPAKRLVIIKVDGLNADLLNNAMRERDDETGKSRLPWLAHIFDQNGIVFENFYVRGISLSAPSWSMLDTGRHTVIRGNVEYDRYTGRAYDYLNSVPFYIGYARKRAVDMPGAEVLDRAGIPLLIDRFHYDQILQSFQLFQRGVSWVTLREALLRTFSGNALVSVLESAAPISPSSSLAKQEEDNLEDALRKPNILYLDYFTGDADHEGHATSEPKALLHVLIELDRLVGRVWTAISQGPLARETLLVMVSDHGMNNTPGIISQTFSLPDLLNSPAGGAHHVITDREQLSDFKLRGINPLVHRVITPSTRSFYLANQSSEYPTAWLDIDGNERAAVQLRNSDVNQIHILLLELRKPDLAPALRRAAARALGALLDQHRPHWTQTAHDLRSEMAALAEAIEARHRQLQRIEHHFSSEQHDLGEDKTYHRLRRELDDWQNEKDAYGSYLKRLETLLAFQPDGESLFTGDVRNLIPEMSLGDRNEVSQLTHYLIGLAPDGLCLSPDGQLDEQKSFLYVNYFALLAAQRAHNNPQPELTDRPIDFTAMTLPASRYDQTQAAPQLAYWLYRDEAHQLVILQDNQERLSVRPVSGLRQDAAGQITWKDEAWAPGYPLELFADNELRLPAGVKRSGWLTGWHSEREWLLAIHKTRYSNGVVGVTEELSPVAANVPGEPGLSPLLRRYEQHRRELVQPDFEVFAADHWNFNVRFPNPGGNHGSFLRISTHSVWMMAGAGLPAQHIEEPYDSLNFAGTLLHLLGRTPPLPERVVPLTNTPIP